MLKCVSGSLSRTVNKEYLLTLRSLDEEDLENRDVPDEKYGLYHIFSICQNAVLDR